MYHLMLLVVHFIVILLNPVMTQVNYSLTMLAPEFLEMDNKIIAILDAPKDQSQWDEMLNDIRNEIQEIKNIMKYLQDNNQEVIQKAYEIYQLGKPKFIDHSISEPEIRDAAQVTEDQFLTFHELRDEIDNLWNDFLDILSEKTGEVLDYGIHGRAARYGEGEGNGGYGGGGDGYGGDGYGNGGGEPPPYGEGGYGGRGGYGGGYRGGRGGRGRRRGGGGGYGGGGYGGGGFEGGYGPPY